MLRAGFIGFGRMGITHFSILNTHPSVKIVAICDASNTLLNVIRKYMEIDFYDNYQKMMEEVDLDFVLISTPADSHAKIINAAIEKGSTSVQRYAHHFGREKRICITPNHTL